MSEAKRDLMSFLEQLAEEKRSGKLKLTGENWSAKVSMVDGKVSRVDVDPRPAWRLGDILRHVHVLSARRFRTANRVAEKQGEMAADALVLRKGWVVPTIYRKYQERLCVRRLFELASKVGYRAAFSAAESEGQDPLVTDVSVPVAYVVNEVANLSRDALMENEPLSADSACFAKTGVAIAHILGGEGDDLPEGAPLLGITPQDRRVFFFCNGEIPFQDLSLILGASPHQLGRSIGTLLAINAIQPVHEMSRWWTWSRRVQRIGRPVMAFAGGIWVTGVVLWIALSVATALDASRPGWSFEAQGYYRSGETGASRVILDALHQFFLNEEAYPRSLEALVEKGHLSRHCFERQIEPRPIKYNCDQDQLGYRLAVGGKEIRVLNGLVSQKGAGKGHR